MLLFIFVLIYNQISGNIDYKEIAIKAMQETNKHFKSEIELLYSLKGGLDMDIKNVFIRTSNESEFNHVMGIVKEKGITNYNNEPFDLEYDKFKGKTCINLYSGCYGSTDQLERAKEEYVEFETIFGKITKGKK